MKIGYGLNLYQNSISSNKQLAFKGDFEDVIALSKKVNIPHTVELEGRKLMGPERTVQPTVERLKIVEDAINNPETKGAWKGLFRAVATAWKKVL